VREIRSFGCEFFSKNTCTLPIIVVKDDLTLILHRSGCVGSYTISDVGSVAHTDLNIGFSVP